MFGGSALPTDLLVQEITEALLKYEVLAIRDQDLTPEQHKYFASKFQPLHIHPSHRIGRGRGGNPELFIVRTTAKSAFANGEGWHSDLWCEDMPPMASLLYVRELPGESGGDTLFANLCDGFAALSESLQQFLLTLDAEHDGRKDLANYDVILDPGVEYPSATHPLIMVHPQTGQPILFVNRSFTKSIEGLRKSESDNLLELLWTAVESNPRFHCRVRWSPGTVVFWDNRCTWHRSIWDYYPSTRHAERVTIAATARPERWVKRP